MIAYIENKKNTNFVEWFQAQGMLTEFILYSGWIEFTGGLDTYYSNQSCFTVCNLCHSETGIADIKLDAMNQSTMLTVSIHRNAWLHLTDHQKQTYKNFLLSRRINKEIL